MIPFLVAVLVTAWAGIAAYRAAHRGARPQTVIYSLTSAYCGAAAVVLLLFLTGVL